MADNFIFSDYLAESSISTSSKRAYKTVLKRFTGWMLDEEISLSDLTPELVSYYLTQYLVTGSSFTTANHQTAINAWLRWLAEANRMPGTFLSLKKSNVDLADSKKRPLSSPQIAKFLASIRQNTLIGKRDYGLVLLMMGCGLRVSEACGADWEDIDRTKERAVLWVKGKGRLTKDRFVVLPEEILTALGRASSGRKKAGPLFMSSKTVRLSTRQASRVVRDRLYEAGLQDPSLSAHSLRHTAATLATEAGADLLAVSLMMRHENLRMTHHYSRYAHREDRLANPVEDKVIQRINEITNGDH